MAKKKSKFRRSNSFTIPMAAVGGFIGAEATQGILNNLIAGNPGEAIKYFPHYAGVASDGVFSYEIAAKNWSPILIGFGVHKLASMLGVNRMLARSGIPLIRI